MGLDILGASVSGGVDLVFVPLEGKFWKVPASAVKSVHQLIFQPDMIQGLIKFRRVAQNRFQNITGGVKMYQKWRFSNAVNMSYLRDLFK